MTCPGIGRNLDAEGEHGHGAMGSLFSSDGTTLYTFGWDGKARVFDVASGASRFELSVGGSLIDTFGLSADEQRLLTVGHDPEEAHIWDLRPTTELEGLHLDGMTITDGVTGGERLALTGMRTTEPAGMVILESDDSEIVAEVPDIQPLSTLAASADGRTLAVQGARYDDNGVFNGLESLWIFDFESGEQVGQVANLCWSRDPDCGNDPATLPMRVGTTQGASLSPDGSLAAVIGTHSQGGFVEDLRTGEVVKVFEAGLVLGRTNFNPTGRHLAVSYGDGEIDLFDTNAWTSTEIDLGGEVNGVRFSPNGRLLLISLGAQGQVVAWDVEDGEETFRLSGHGGTITQTGFSADGSRILTAATDGIRIWDAATGRETQRIQFSVESAFWHPNGVDIYAIVDGDLAVLTTDTNELIEIARSRVTRNFTDAECRRYLHAESCPDQ